MRIGALRDWNPAPGAVYVWEPTERCRAAVGRGGRAAGHASFLQAGHLDAHARRPEDRAHRAWTAVTTRLDGPPPLPAVTRALHDLLRDHEGLRTWFEPGGERRVLAADDVELAPRRVDVPEGADWARTVRNLVEQASDVRCQPDAWPGHLLVAVLGDDDLDLSWTCDHAFTDGLSQLLLPAELESRIHGGAPSSGTSGSPVRHAAQESHAAASWPDDDPDLLQWVELVTRHGGLPTSPLDLGLAPGETAPVHVEVVELLDADGLEALDGVAHAWGVRFSDIVWSVVAANDLAARPDAPDTFWGMTVLGTRDRSTATSQGWFCTFSPVEIAARTDDPRELALAAAEGLATARRLARVPLARAVESIIAAGVLPETLSSPQLLSYLDLERLPNQESTAHVRGLHYTGEGRTANSSLWVNREPGRLSLVCQRPLTGVADRVVPAHLDALAERFRALGREPAEPVVEPV